ncbi:MAG TPA: hypothetical protein VFX98_08345 [Longimicrobiaceae bacterium]|nr:hypothetical protein [Longimicrobiaceae bacterium]
MRTRLPPVVLLLVLAAACVRPQHRPGLRAVEQAAFWHRLEQLCGRAYEGAVVEGNASDSVFRRSRLVMHVRDCAPGEIRIPFHVGGDRSRTWVVTHTAEGLRLKHDHRHADGTPDSISWYGGDTRGQGMPERQAFPADTFTARLVPAAATNVWSLEIVPGESFTYGLTRESTGRRFRVRFDLARPVPPPAP